MFVTDVLFYLVLFFLGSVFGSFLGAFSYRMERARSVFKGRSLCEHCKKQIAWFDNIPVLSFLWLRGKCRICGGKIGYREIFLEIVTGLLFVEVFVNYGRISISFPYLFLSHTYASMLILGFIVCFMVFVFITDFERQVIFDEVTFFALAVLVLFFLLFSKDIFYLNFLSGFIASMFFLFLHFLTFGRGMGLGDVKFAIVVGLILGPTNTLLWIMLAFFIGAVVGVILIALGKSKFGHTIAFGPFLVVSFFLILFFSQDISRILLPGIFM